MASTECKTNSIRRLLVANRAEIAERVFTSARSLGIETVALYSDPDANLRYVRSADQSIHLAGSTPAETYLDVNKVLEAAVRSGCDGIHPGYGFLSENPKLAQGCLDLGITFVGPSVESIEIMGSKLASKALALRHGVPTLDSLDVTEITSNQAGEFAKTIGYPVLVKASAGGGGRGMRIVESPEQLDQSIESAKREALNAFGDATVFIEKYVQSPRHIEIQVVADQHGRAIHLCERECSIQRRHQKIVEESPSPFFDKHPELRLLMGQAAVDLAQAVSYVGLGTVEFVVDAQGNFYFLEMNTRLQVEHPVTEAVLGIDLVRIQIEVAQNRHLGDLIGDIDQSGHAIEVRLYAENPQLDWRPESGTLEKFLVPGQTEFQIGGAIRVDSGFEDNSVVSTYYDSMLAKVIAYSDTRQNARKILRKTLIDSAIFGVHTNRDLLIGILSNSDFVDGNTDTGFLVRNQPNDLIEASLEEKWLEISAVAGALVLQARERENTRAFVNTPSGWRNSRSTTQFVDFSHNEEVVRVEYFNSSDGFRIANLSQLGLESVRVISSTSSQAILEVDGRTHRFQVLALDTQVFIHSTLGLVCFGRLPRFPAGQDEISPGSLVSPMPGVVVRIEVLEGDRVEGGTVMMALEAMKMEHKIEAPITGTVKEILVSVGSQVEASQLLVVVEEEQ